MAETSGSTSIGAQASRADTGSREPSAAELVTRLTQQSTELIRSELKLAQVEMTEKAKHAGVGAGLLGGAGVIGLYAGGALIATIILVLSLFLDAWLAALIVTVVLLAIAGVVALMGKKQVGKATPAAPEHTIDSVKRDVDTIKGGAHS